MSIPFPHCQHAVTGMDFLPKGLLILLGRHFSTSQTTLAPCLSRQHVLKIVRMSLEPLKPSNHWLCSTASCCACRENIMQSTSIIFTQKTQICASHIFRFIAFDIWHYYYWSIGQVGRVFANGLEDWDSIKKKKIQLDTSLSNTQYYKVQIKGKWSSPGKGVMSSPTPQCSS